METGDETLTALNDLHLRHDGPIPSAWRTRPLSAGEPDELLLKHEVSRLIETIRALAASRASVRAARVPGDARLVRLDRAVARLHARARALLSKGR